MVCGRCEKMLPAQVPPERRRFRSQSPPDLEASLAKPWTEHPACAIAAARWLMVARLGGWLRRCDGLDGRRDQLKIRGEHQHQR